MKCGSLERCTPQTAMDGDAVYLFEGQIAVHIKLRVPPLLQHRQCTNLIFRHYLVTRSLAAKALSASIVGVS